MVPPAMKLRPLLALMSLFSLLFGTAKADPLKVGDNAPAVSGITDEGKTLSLGDTYKNNAYTVVWFYPKALTGGCTKQGCSLRDAAADLKAKGATIVGVSVDPVEKQKEFKEVNHFPYPLIADTDKKIVQAFGQPDKAVASRECYVVNKAGKIVYKDSNETTEQAAKVLAFLATQKG